LNIEYKNMKKIKIYAEHLEETALEQFNSAMEQDYSIQGALMPDAHTGYTLPIGAVVATDNVVVPAWVGYDIGCGMCALPTSFSVNDVRKKATEIFAEIYQRIPVGFNVHNKPIETHMDPSNLSPLGRIAFDARKGFRGLGTLGGGNHFIEIGVESTGRVWIIIHSGSRGVGHGIATEYIKLAHPEGKAKEGHYSFGADSDKGLSYINDLNWALEYALENRRHMMSVVENILGDCCEGDADWRNLINRNHNHAEYAHGMWIHRKGATHAEDGMWGVIPGNMRDGSFIVKGQGNPDSLWSSSHGAGRVMGRKQAKRELSVEDFTTTMSGVTAQVGEGTLDEAPDAYKNIYEVMELQTDLVDIITHVKPIINIKG